MINYGNTGQRYKLRKFAKIEQEDEHLRVSLECGHTYHSYPSYDGSTINYYQNLIDQGKRTRCLDCAVNA
jgi:hypothetical protein